MSRKGTIVSMRVPRTDSRVPPMPPREVREQVCTAQRLLDELAALGREVRVDRRDGRIRFELCERDGTVLREIAPSQAVDVVGWARFMP
jgi:hypothetical protein